MILTGGDVVVGIEIGGWKVWEVSDKGKGQEV